MAVSKVKRNQFATFLNTTTSAGAVYVLVGPGIKTGKIAMNPKVTEETYVSDDTATTMVDGYAPKLAFDMIAIQGDPAFAWVDALRAKRATLSDAETDIVQVYYYQSSSNGLYPAERQPVSVQVDDFGGDGGLPLTITFTFNYLGIASSGYFSASSKTFTAN
jgi:hypothetical protein